MSSWSKIKIEELAIQREETLASGHGNGQYWLWLLCEIRTDGCIKVWFEVRSTNHKEARKFMALMHALEFYNDQCGLRSEAQ